MLYLTRKIGDSIQIGDDITLTIKEIKGKTVKIGFDFPEEIAVLRTEIYEKIKAENAKASTLENQKRLTSMLNL